MYFLIYITPNVLFVCVTFISRKTKKQKTKNFTYRVQLGNVSVPVNHTDQWGVLELKLADVLCFSCETSKATS